jgi:hypothetical protein
MPDTDHAISQVCDSRASSVHDFRLPQLPDSDFCKSLIPDFREFLIPNFRDIRTSRNKLTIRIHRPYLAIILCLIQQICETSELDGALFLILFSEMLTCGTDVGLWRFSELMTSQNNMEQGTIGYSTNRNHRKKILSLNLLESEILWWDQPGTS